MTKLLLKRFGIRLSNFNIQFPCCKKQTYGPFDDWKAGNSYQTENAVKTNHESEKRVENLIPSRYTVHN